MASGAWEELLGRLNHSAYPAVGVALEDTWNVLLGCRGDFTGLLRQGTADVGHGCLGFSPDAPVDAAGALVRVANEGAPCPNNKACSNAIVSCGTCARHAGNLDFFSVR